MEGNIVEYRVTQAVNKEDLATKVMNNIKLGWCPFGGVNFMAYTYNNRSGPVLDEKWQQALVKYGTAPAPAPPPMNASQVGSGRRTRRRR